MPHCAFASSRTQCLRCQSSSGRERKGSGVRDQHHNSRCACMVRPGMKNHSPPMVQFVRQGPERKQTIWRTRGQGDVFSPLEGDVSLRDDVSKSAKKQLARNVNGNAHATNGWSECELERVQCESKIFEAARPTFAGMRIHLCCGALICPTFVRACARRQVVSASPLQLHRMPRSHFLCCWFAAGLCDADPLLRIFLSFCIAQILLHHFHDASVS